MKNGGEKDRDFWGIGMGGQGAGKVGGKREEKGNGGVRREKGRREKRGKERGKEGGVVRRKRRKEKVSGCG
ncbi:hypothetical protein, partial [Kiloniella majae]|uniref:hypothetical protein n=1 Tax=Kiloniella majae TaxID=1938558 RepID=UPI0018EA0B9B